ncbi:MAG: LysR family transcriptional regulator [Litoreibacter sp.]|nr:LysR family transcriptional regulator [Litoreibacter sp.]
MPSIKSLRVFVLTMEQGSLTLAAQSMHISQPAATRLLMQLEEEFGAQLFFRDRKTLTPSREAEMFYPEASRILSSYEELPAILAALKNDDTVPLKVVGQTRCSLGLVTPAITQLSQENPQIEIHLDVHKRRELRLRKIWDRFDVGVFATPLHVSFAEIRYSRKVACEVVVHKSHPLAKKELLSPGDLKTGDYITVKHAQQGRSVAGETVAGSDLDIPVKHEVSNAFAAVSLVRQRVGFTITDRFAVDPSHVEELAFIPLNPAPTVEYAVCVSEDTREHPMTERLIEKLVSIMETVPKA